MTHYTFKLLNILIYYMIGNGCFENVALFRYLGTTITNENLIQKEIKRKLNSGMLATIQSRTFCPLVCCLKA
jgi:hypothetical protein